MCTRFDLTELEKTATYISLSYGMHLCVDWTWNDSYIYVRGALD